MTLMKIVLLNILVIQVLLGKIKVIFHGKHIFLQGGGVMYMRLMRIQMEMEKLIKQMYLLWELIMDRKGHGTHVAGIAAGNGVLKGVAPDVKLYVYKVMDSFGTLTVSYIISAIERSVDQNVDGNY